MLSYVWQITMSCRKEEQQEQNVLKHYTFKSWKIENHNQKMTTTQSGHRADSAAQAGQQSPGETQAVRFGRRIHSMILM